MKKLTFSINTIWVSAILLSTFSVYGMKKDYTQVTLDAEEYNDSECPFTSLPNEKLFEIFSHCHSYDGYSMPKENIQNFMKLSMVCKNFNRLLTVETIGDFCKDYLQVFKNAHLQALIRRIDRHCNYLPISKPAVILVHAGADPNEMYVGCCILEMAMKSNDEQLITTLLNHNAKPNIFSCSKDYSKPIFFYARTAKIAQMFIDKDINVRIADKEGLNVLWFVISNDYPAEMLKFYLQYKVDATTLSRRDCVFYHGGSLLHALADRFLCGKEHMPEFLKKCELLLGVIPHMVNTTNKQDQTPLDIVQEKFAMLKRRCKDYDEAFEKFDASLRAIGGLTAQELAEKVNALFFTNISFAKK